MSVISVPFWYAPTGSDFSPLELSPALWLRDDQGLVLDENGRVSQWTDQSGNGRDATRIQAQETQRPNPTSEGINFNGGTSLRVETQGVYAHYFAVFRSPYNVFSNYGGVIDTAINGGARLGNFQANNTFFEGGGIPRAVRQNGVDVPAAGSFPLQNIDQMMLMELKTKSYQELMPLYVSGIYHDGYNTALIIREIVAFSNDLLDTDAMKVQTYLASKYSLTMG